MCKITILEIGENIESFNCVFVDCENGQANFRFELHKELPQNQSGHYIYTGTNTEGEENSGSVVVPNSERLNPTKVFYYIAKKIKEVLCPKCT